MTNFASKTTARKSSEQGIVDSANLVGMSVHLQPGDFALPAGPSPAGSLGCVGWLPGHSVPLFDFWDSFALSD